LVRATSERARNELAALRKRSAAEAQEAKLRAEYQKKMKEATDPDERARLGREFLEQVREASRREEAAKTPAQRLRESRLGNAARLNSLLVATKRIGEREGLAGEAAELVQQLGELAAVGGSLDDAAFNSEYTAIRTAFAALRRSQNEGIRSRTQQP